MQEKAEDQLEAARKKEVAAAQNFELRKQALDDEIRFAKRDMEQAKKGIASYAEKKSTAEGELQKSTKDLRQPWMDARKRPSNRTPFGFCHHARFVVVSSVMKSHAKDPPHPLSTHPFVPAIVRWT